MHAAHQVQLIAAAWAVLSPRRVSPTLEAGGVAAALITTAGTVFRGVCIDAACGIGSCAEHGAIAAMLTAGESRIAMIVAVGANETILPPCGRCRELIAQVDPGNTDTVVILPNGVRTLSELLPEMWFAGR